MKKLLLFCLLFAFSFYLFCLENFSVSIKPEIGVLNGQINEYVFSINNGSWYTESRLDWQVNAIPYAGVEVESKLYDKFSISMGGRVGLPKRSGIMEDFDWLNITDLTRFTNYSRHENYLLGYEKFGVSFGWYFYPVSWVSVMPFFSVSEETYLFDGRNGYTQYASYGFWNAGLPKDYCEEDEYPDGRVISYSQDRYLIDLGLRTDIKLSRLFELSLAGRIGFYNQIKGHDYHLNIIKKYREYQDVIAGLMPSEYDFAAEFSILLNKHNKVSLKTDYQIVPVVQGSTDTREIGKTDWDNHFTGGCGAGSKILNVSLMYSLMF